MYTACSTRVLFAHFVFCSPVVNVSAQGSCTITSTNSPDLIAAAGILAHGTEYLMIECECVGDNGLQQSEIRWFLPDATIVATQANVLDGAPYHLNGILVIPTFNHSYDGTYTCGVGNNYPPTPMTTITLSLPGEMSEVNFNCVCINIADFEISIAFKIFLLQTDTV